MKAKSPSVDKGPPWWKSIRYRIAVIGFFGMTNIYVQRHNLSIGIVCMVNHTAVDILHHLENPSLRDNSTPVHDIKFNENQNLSLPSYLNNVTSLETGQQLPVTQSCKDADVSSKLQREDGEFVWSKDTQGLLLGALFWGYVSSQIICGYIIKRFGLRWTVGPSMVLMSILTMATQGASILSPWALFVVRILIGITNGFGMPGMFFLLTQWAPPEEKGRFTSIVFSGNMVGTIVVLPTSAFLCVYGFAGGWPSIFYLSGLSNLLWCVAWFWWVYDSPSKHPSIHPKERDYIISSLDLTGSSSSKREVFPWCSVLTSFPVWAIVIAQTGVNWGYYLMLANLPLYMREVLKFDVKSNGIFSMLPYICMWFVLTIIGFITDRVVKRFGILVARKGSTIIGLAVPAGLLIIMSYLDCDSIPVVITLLCLSVGLMAVNFMGVMINFFDIAGQHSGQVMTISNTIANIPGIVTPYVVVEFTKDNTREQWQHVFFLTAGIMCFGCLTFLIFAKSTTQKWAQTKEICFDIGETETMNKS